MYETVLLGLLGSAGGSGSSAEQREQSYASALKLVEEMNAKGIVMSAEALSVLLSNALSAGVGEVAEALSVARYACVSFGADAWRPSERPPERVLAGLLGPPQDPRAADALSVSPGSLERPSPREHPRLLENIRASSKPFSPIPRRAHHARL